MNKLWTLLALALICVACAVSTGCDIMDQDVDVYLYPPCEEDHDHADDPEVPQ